MKNKILALAVLCLVLSSCAEKLTSTTSLSKNERPNVILVITDDQGYGDLGAHGNTIINTPHLDALHKESIRLTDFHVSPTCAPTRSALMTGRFTNRTGVWHTVGGWSLLREEEKTLADMFTEAGYATAAFGKWHLGDNYPFRPFDRGFQYTVMHGAGGVGQTPDYWDNDYFDDTYFKNGIPTPYKGYCTDVFFDEAVKFIETVDKQPFFCYISTNAPHGPFNVPPAYYDMYKDLSDELLTDTQKRFYGMITNIDDNMGELRAALEEMGIADNTILIFMTDNGTSKGLSYIKDKKGKKSIPRGYNAGMRGIKNSDYDGGHRVPFFIYWKDGKLTGGKDVEHLTAHIDVMPTLADLCGIDLPKDHRAIDGTDLSPLLLNPEAEWTDRMLVTDSQRDQVPKKWKKSAVMSDEWRLVKGNELYRIKEDPSQKNNVASEYLEQVEAMRTYYDQWWESVSEEFDVEVNIPIGTPQENPAVITIHDFHATGQSLAWHQGHIRKGLMTDTESGYWSIDIKEAGEYSIAMRRYPRESGLAINATTPEVLPEEVPGLHLKIPKGKSLQFKEASVRVGQQFEATQSVEPNAEEVVFTAHLEAGVNQLVGGFNGEDGYNGVAYYIYIEKK